MFLVSLLIIKGCISVTDGNTPDPGSTKSNLEGRIFTAMMCLVSFWKGKLVETLEKWEKEFEIETKIKLTGRETVKLKDAILGKEKKKHVFSPFLKYKFVSCDRVYGRGNRKHVQRILQHLSLH